MAPACGVPGDFMSTPQLPPGTVVDSRFTVGNAVRTRAGATVYDATDAQSGPCSVTIYDATNTADGSDNWDSPPPGASNVASIGNKHDGSWPFEGQIGLIAVYQNKVFSKAARAAAIAKMQERWAGGVTAVS